MISDYVIKRTQFYMPIDIGIDNIYRLRPLIPTEEFRIGKAKGGGVFHTGEITLSGKGKATVDGSGSIIAICDDVTLNETKLQINGRNNTIIIGPRCKIKDVTIVIKGNNCLVAIGADTSWESGVCICSDGMSVNIGNDCMFSNNVQIRVADGHSIWEKGGGKRISKPSDVIIRDHVWLGNSSRVGKGTDIGEGSIIGQMSLANGKLESHSIYGGIPARLIKKDIEWSRTQSYDDVPEKYRIDDSIFSQIK